MNRLQIIDGAKKVDIKGEETIKDVEGMLQWFRNSQQDTLRRNVETEGKNAEQSISDLKNLKVKKLDEVEAYKEKLNNSRHFLVNLKVALDSYYTSNEKYFPEVSESRNQVKTQTVLKKKSRL